MRDFSARLKRLEADLPVRVLIPQLDGSTASMSQDEQLSLMVSLMLMVANLNAGDPPIVRGWELLEPEDEHFYEMLRDMDKDQHQEKVINLCWSFLDDLEYPEGKAYPYGGPLIYPDAINRPN